MKEKGEKKTTTMNCKKDMTKYGHAQHKIEARRSSEKMKNKNWKLSEIIEQWKGIGSDCCTYCKMFNNFPNVHKSGAQK